MLVKIMSGEDCPDDDPRKSFTLIEGVVWYHARREDGKLVMEITTKYESEVQTFGTDGNVYVMNDAGKTIAHVGVSPPHSSSDAEDSVTNSHSVPKKIWKRWSNEARRVFNYVYEDIQRVSVGCFVHPRTIGKGMDSEEFKCIAWNSAWTAACGVDDLGPTDSVTVYMDR